MTSQTMAQTKDTRFEEGVSAYEAQKFDQAQEIFRSLVAESPDNPHLLFNLGLAEYQLGHLGLALGLWRKARYLAPDFKQTEFAIEFVEEKLVTSSMAPPFYQTIWKYLGALPLSLWGFISLVTFSLLGWFSVEYGVKKQLSFLNWPNWILFVIPIFIFSSFYVLVETSKRSEQKATVISQDIETRVTPSESAPALGSLVEGQVVQVKQSLGPWTQVVTTDGRPGWVPTQSLIYFKEI